MIEVIKRYSDGIFTDEFHRYKSWEICNEAFNTFPKSDTHTLHLAFYLASWGMYRGSSGLLQKNHLIHQKTVDLIFEKWQHLNCNSDNEIVKEQIQDIIQLKNSLSEIYSKIYYTKGNEPEKPITPTDTLISKIILGTLACIPAYDRYFIDGLKSKGFKNFTFNKNSLIELFDFIETNSNEIKQCQDYLVNETKKHYSIMKIVDMYFWQLGYEKELESLKK